MKYPTFLKENSSIGITALSSGAGKDILEVKRSFNNLKRNFHIIATKDSYGSEIVSDNETERAKEFNELLDEDIDYLLILRGGNFLLETLDKLDYQKLIQKNIWVGGYSDPSTLLYTLTCKYDLATIYGFNAKSFDNLDNIDQRQNLEIIKGTRNKQESFTSDLKSLNGDFSSSGILIGGCLDALRNIFGTDFDDTNKFIEKYHDKKIIWYFDIFEMNSIDTYLTLLQMKLMGYFKYSDTFLIGKILFSDEREEIKYVDAYQKIFGNSNIVIDTDIGHVKPSFTIINGSLGRITYKDNHLSIIMECNNENNG